MDPARARPAGKKRPIRAHKFSKPKEISQMLAEVIYQDAVVVTVVGAGNPSREKIIAMISVVTKALVDDIALLPFRDRMFIALFMDADNQAEQAARAFDQAAYTFQTTKLVFHRFRSNLHSVKDPLRQRVILALEGVPPESWNIEAITELLDNSYRVEEIYGQHHINDLSIFRLAAWTTDVDLIPKIIDWHIETKEANHSGGINCDIEAAMSTILVHIEKLFDYFDEDSGSDTDGETLRHYEESRPRVPVIKNYQWTERTVDTDNGPIEGTSTSSSIRRLPTQLKKHHRF